MEKKISKLICFCSVIMMLVLAGCSSPSIVEQPENIVAEEKVVVEEPVVEETVGE